ncbi:TonB-dependent receptor [Salisaeta longa]|uniref:TonB-dependent receptor n=1 Tax=Salisaeta longa TaxID=503170 RepID=UPI001E577098|nr:TonB-dependent receptor [Salisaeta longa]
MSQPTAILQGTVQTPAGAPLTGANVALPDLHRGTTVGADGAFRIDNLPPGTFTVAISFVGYQTASRTVTLQAGAPTRLTVTLQPKIINAEEVVVTGTAVATSTLRSVQDVDVLSPENLAVERTASLGDLLAQNVPGVSSISTGSQAGKPVLRGLSGNRIVLLTDGISQEFYQFGVRHFPNTNANEAERIEVVRGASSILYGSDALGGAINIITRRTPTADAEETLVGGRVGSQYYTNNNERVGTVELYGARGATGVRVGLERRVGDNYKTPDVATFFETTPDDTPVYNAPKYAGEIPFTNFEQWSGYAQVGHEFSGGHVQLYADRWVNRQNFLLPVGGPADDTPNSPPPVGLGQNLAHTNVALKGHVHAGPFVIKPRLSYQRALRQAAPGGTTLADIRANGGYTGYDYPLDLLTNIYTGRVEALHPELGGLSGTIGAEVQVQDANTRGPAELQPSGQTTNVGVFAFEEWEQGNLKLSAGARVDYIRVTAVPNERTTDPDLLENTYTTASGALGGNYLIADGVAIASNLSMGFRAPTLFELYADGVHGGVAAVQRGTPTLDPERAYSADLSLRVSRARFSGEVTGYVNYITNYIYLANTGATAANGLPIYEARQTDATLPGLEAKVEGAVQPWLQVGAQAALLRGSGARIGDATTDKLPLLPADNVSGFVRWRPALGPSVRDAYLEGRVRHVFASDAAGRYEPFAQFDGTPFGTASTRAYTTLSVRAGATVALGAVPVQLRVGVENLTDTVYRDFLDTYKGYALSPGRSVRVGVSVPFEARW